jgi:type III secretion system FlhB-like substrate exporter
MVLGYPYRDNEVVFASAIDTGKAGKAPRVLAHSSGHEAEQMLLIARHLGVPVVRDRGLSARVRCFSSGQPLPRELLLCLLEALKALSKRLAVMSGRK